MIVAVGLDTGALAALISILVTVVVLAMIVSRIVKRDPRIRVAQVGVFVRRELLPAKGEVGVEIEPVDDEEQPQWRPVDDPPSEIETQQWPKRDDESI